jgi:hypothetical protein
MMGLSFEIKDGKVCIRMKFWFNIRRATLERNFDITFGRAAHEVCSAT